MGAFDVLGGNTDDFAVRPVGLVLGEAAETDLWTLQVGEDTDGVARFVGRLADPLVVLLVIGVLAMREVEAGDVHSVLHQAEDLVLASDGGAQRAHDLRSSIQHVTLFYSLFVTVP